MRTKVSSSNTVRLLFFLPLVGSSSKTASKCLFVLEVCLKQLISNSYILLIKIEIYFGLFLVFSNSLDMCIDESGITVWLFSSAFAMQIPVLCNNLKKILCIDYNCY